MSEKKSAYVLHVMASYTYGIEWNDFHAYTDPAHLEWFMRRICENQNEDAWAIVACETKVGIYVVQRGVLVELLDLRPMIYARLDEEGPYRVDDADALARVMVNAARVEAGEPRLRSKDRASFEPFTEGELDNGVFSRVQLSVDWPAVLAKLPRLETPLLGPRETTSVANPRRISSELDSTVTFGSIGWMGEPIEDLPPGVEPVERDDDDDDYEEGDEEFEDEDDNADDGEA